jgi:hypothetical protein
MEYDFAIIYFGLTRSVKKTHESHKKHVFDILKKENLSYKTFMHTWKTKEDIQNVRDSTIPQKIDYLEYNLLSPDFYKLDDEGEFLESINMNNYFYKDVWRKIGHSRNGEWLPKMVSNHLCMLESQKRCFNMVKECVLKGDKFKFIIFIRPDITIHTDLPIDIIIANYEKIHIPNHSHYEGINDQFAIMNYNYAHLYGNRIDELADFRRTRGRIVGEKYCKFIILKNNMKINQLNFKYSITRP